jgi:CTP:molybdopterin cytidylyltransferase MocA
VIGPHVVELAELVDRAGAAVCRLDAPTPDMRATVEHGLLWIEDHLAPKSDDAWLLLPADHPALDAGVIAQLLAARAAYPEASLWVPTWDGRRGHPPLLAWSHVAGIRQLEAGVGLNVYLRRHAAATCEVPIPGARPDDLDTPEDYARLLEDWEKSER